MTLDLVPVWAVILALGVFLYVLTDGFDLGVGILFAGAPDDRARNLMIDSIAPVWDGNETWLILGGAGLLAVFPLAFAILMPALYLPILLMLLGLIFRGVAIEFRTVPGAIKSIWDGAFFVGSSVATFAQGVVLGNFIEGFPVVERHFAGGSWDWVRPFSLFTGVGLLFGYGLLGATWLILKTDGALQDWARARARQLLLGVVVLFSIAFAWTPLAVPRIAVRWLTWPHSLMLLPLPVVGLFCAYGVWWGLARRRELLPFVGAMGIFVTCYLGLGASILPYIVPYHLGLWDAAASHKTQGFLLVGTLFLLPIILMYTGWSYWIFRGKVRGEHGY